MAKLGVGDYDEEFIFFEFRDGQIGFELSSMIEPLSVGDHANLPVHAICRNIIQPLAGISALNQEFAHKRHVHEDHAISTSVVLGLPPRPPVHSAPRELINFGLVSGRSVPIGAFPTTDIFEVSAMCRETVMERRLLRASRGFRRLCRIVAFVNHSEHLDSAFAAILRIGLIREKTIDIHPSNVHVGAAIHDPSCQRRPMPPPVRIPMELSPAATK